MIEMVRGDIIANRIWQKFVPGAQSIKRGTDILAYLRCADFDLEPGEKVKRSLSARRVSDRENFQRSRPVFVRLLVCNDAQSIGEFPCQMFETLPWPGRNDHWRSKRNLRSPIPAAKAEKRIRSDQGKQLRGRKLRLKPMQRVNRVVWFA